MNTFKSTVVLATLLGVGYGVHVVLNKPMPGDSASTQNADQWELPKLDLENLNQGRPDVSAMADDTSPPPFEPTQAETPLASGPESPVQLAAGDLSDVPPVASAAYAGVPDPHNSAATLASAKSGALAAGLPANTPNATDPLTEANGQAFEQIWQSAQTKLASGQYADALFTLSLAYSEPNLNNEQRSRLIPLLDQLAGTVIYSHEHHLEQPYTVQQGDTLAQIAKDYQISVEFLTRINGLPSTSVLTLGQQLKVVRGPFRGELSLSGREITVFLGRYYAGRFSVGVGSDLPGTEMLLEVTEIAGARPYVDPTTNQQLPAGDPASPYGEHWIGLGSSSSTNPRLGIHSSGQEVDASDTRGCISLNPRAADDLKAILSVASKFSVVR